MSRADVAPLESLSASERSNSWRMRFVVGEWLSRSLVVVPSLYILFALVLAEAVPQLEGSRDSLGLRIDVDTARTILSAVAGGMIAFTGLVVSIAVVVVQFGASQYTPRLVSRFRRDPVVKHSLGIFIAPAIYALVSLRVLGRDGSKVVPSITVALNLALLIAAVLVFFLLVSRLLDLLRPRRVIAQIVEQGLEAIREVYPFERGRTPSLDVPQTPIDAVVCHEGPPAVLAALDRGRLVRAAAAADVVVEVAVSVGGYLPPGAPAFLIRGNASAVDARELRRSAILEDERTIAQDPAFAVRAIVDTALRALSPAVNDPTTAVQAVDGLETLLAALADRDLQRGRIADAGGRLRLVYPTPSWVDLLDLSLTEIRHYGADTPQIARRLRSLLLTLIETSPAVCRPALDDQLARLDSAVRAAYPDPVERAHAEVADHMGLGASRG